MWSKIGREGRKRDCGLLHLLLVTESLNNIAFRQREYGSHASAPLQILDFVLTLLQNDTTGQNKILHRVPWENILRVVGRNVTRNWNIEHKNRHALSFNLFYSPIGRVTSVLHDFHFYILHCVFAVFCFKYCTHVCVQLHSPSNGLAYPKYNYEEGSRTSVRRLLILILWRCSNKQTTNEWK